MHVGQNRAPVQAAAPMQSQPVKGGQGAELSPLDQRVSALKSHLEGLKTEHARSVKEGHSAAKIESLEGQIQETAAKVDKLQSLKGKPLPEIPQKANSEALKSRPPVPNRPLPPRPVKGPSAPVIPPSPKAQAASRFNKFLGKGLFSRLKQRFKDKPPATLHTPKPPEGTSPRAQALHSPKAPEGPSPRAQALHSPKAPEGPSPRAQLKATFSLQEMQQVKALDAKAKGMINEYAALNPHPSNAAGFSTVDNFCQAKGITKELVAKEAEFTGQHPEIAKYSMAIRYTQLSKAGADPSLTNGSLQKRAEITGYSKEFVTSIEGNLEELLAAPKGAQAQSKMDGFVVCRFNGEGKSTVIIQEAVLGQGAFKEARAATDYFAARSPQDRRLLADVRPKEGNQISPDFQAKDFVTEMKWSTVSESDIVCRMEGDLESSSSSSISSASSLSQVAEGAAPESESSVIYEEGTFVQNSGTFIQAEEAEGTFVQNSGTFVQAEEAEGSVVFMEEKPSDADVPDFAKIAKEHKDVILQDDGKESVSEVQEYLKEIKIEADMAGRKGFLPFVSIYDIPGAPPAAVKPSSGFMMEGLRSPEGDVLREPLMVRNLDDFIENVGEGATKKDVAHSLNLFENATEGLVELHNEGKCHNDIKPENFLVMPDGKAVLTDFGTVKKARLERRALMGTPHFMAPEVAGGVLNKPGDVWSMGISMQQFLKSSGGTKANELPTFTAQGLTSEVSPSRYILQLGKLKNQGDLGAAYEKNYPEPNKSTEPFQWLCWKTTRIDPSQRFTMQEVNDFIKNNKESMINEISSFNK